MEALLSCFQLGWQQSQPRMAGLLERDRAEMLPRDQPPATEALELRSSHMMVTLTASQ